MNTKAYTYIHPSTGTFSCIDLSFCHPSLFLDFSWNVHPDLCGSDHHPILIESHSDVFTPTQTKWKLYKSDWTEFSQLCDLQLNEQSFLFEDDPVSQFNCILLEIADRTIPKSSNNHRRIPKPWFTEECKEAVINRKRLLQKFKIQPTTVNLITFKKAQALARKTIRTAKRTCWRNYVSKLSRQVL